MGRASMEVVNGATVLVYKSATTHSDNDGALHIRFSNDYGATWSDRDKTLAGAAVTNFPMNPSTLTPGEDAGEPWLYIAPNGNLILHMWRADYGVTTNGTYQSVSTDGGATWSVSAQVDFTGIADDAKVFATDDHFVYDGVIYAGARVYAPGDVAPANCLNILIKSADNGATWEYVSDISSYTTDTIEVGLEYIGNNTILALLRDMSSAKSYSTRSTDMGATWAALSDVTAKIKTVGRVRIYTLAHLRGEANWWTDTNMVHIGHETTTPGSSMPRQNSVWLSFDSGTTWAEQYHLDDIVDDAGYGDIIYDPNTGKYVNVTYQGTALAASLVQYKFNITP